MLGTADVRSRGPLWGSSALLPPKPSVSARPNLSEPSPDEIYCAVSVCVQPGSSRVHLAFIYKEPRIRSMPPHTHWKHSHRNKNTRVAGCTASSERSRDASCWMLLCICLGLIPQASRLLLFWASAQLTRGRRSLTVVMFDSPTSQPAEPVLLIDSF